MEEKWRQWHPIEELDLIPKYYLHGVLDDVDGLRIFLEGFNGESPVTVQFPGYVVSYRCTEEQAAFLTLSKITGQIGCHAFSSWTFFAVENSPYIQQIAYESQGIYPAQNLMHFAIIHADGILEVITSEPPQICKGWVSAQTVLE